MQAPRTHAAGAGEDGGVPAVPQPAGETPFVTDPAEVAAFDIPVEYVRRMEDAQRAYGEHYMQQRRCANAWNHAAMTVGLQCCWLGVGAWIVSRGLRYSDPLNSVVARWVQHSRVRRLTTPISCFGLFIFAATCIQLPYDVKLLREASAAMEAETALMKTAMGERQQAYRAGQLAKEQLATAEAEAFAKGMK